VSVTKTRDQLGFLEQSLDAADRSLELSTKRYQEGYSDFQRVLTAQRARAQASSAYVANQGAHVNAVITLYKALGGGWQAETGEALLPENTRTVMSDRTDWNGMLDAPLPDPMQQASEPERNE